MYVYVDSKLLYKNRIHVHVHVSYFMYMCTVCTHTCRGCLYTSQISHLLLYPSLWLLALDWVAIFAIASFTACFLNLVISWEMAQNFVSFRNPWHVCTCTLHWGRGTWLMSVVWAVVLGKGYQWRSWRPVRSLVPLASPPCWEDHQPPWCNGSETQAAIPWWVDEHVQFYVAKYECNTNV